MDENYIDFINSKNNFKYFDIKSCFFTGQVPRLYDITFEYFSLRMQYLMCLTRCGNNPVHLKRVGRNWAE